jgi:tRNA pseudouridine32 synthase/23S rRNA pseudouridine746 synthase
MPIEPTASEPSIRLVYCDQSILVMDKPSGLLSVPGKGLDKQDCLSARAQREYADAMVVHRLDMATSGLIVMARGALVQRTLSEAFANRMVTKHYEAVVRGNVAVPHDGWRVIDLPIGVDWPNRPRRVIDQLSGKASLTRLQINHFDARRQVSHVTLEPLTGRTHQLRVHLQAIGNPILGDTLYAPRDVAAMAPRLLLHASGLGFIHPVTGLTMQFDLQRLKYTCDFHSER